MSHELLGDVARIARWRGANCPKEGVHEWLGRRPDCPMVRHDLQSQCVRIAKRACANCPVVRHNLLSWVARSATLGCARCSAGWLDLFRADNLPSEVAQCARLILESLRGARLRKLGGTGCAVGLHDLQRGCTHCPVDLEDLLLGSRQNVPVEWHDVPAGLRGLSNDAARVALCICMR